jgi:hypothetical protein
MSILRTYNLQNPDSAGNNIELTQNGGAIVSGVSTFVSSLTAQSGIRVSSGSSIGIGTDNPTAELEVATSVDGEATLATFKNTSGGGTNETVDIKLGLQNSLASNVILRAGKEGNHSSGPACDNFFSIHTTLDNTSSEKLRITSGGLLGVGTNNPDRMLSVSDQTNGNLARFIGPTNNLFIMNNRSGIIDLNSSGTGDHLCLGTQNIERIRITSGGEVQIANGNLKFSTAGTGIDFSATTDSSGAMSSEVLDDYEEGTFTPKYTTSSGGDSGITHYVQSGTYVKIGKLVYIEITLATSDWSSGVDGDILIQNLPFTMKDSTVGSFNISFRREWNTNIGENLLGRFNKFGSTTASIKFYKNDTTSGSTISVIHTDFMDGSHENYVYGSGWYQVP